MTDHPDFDTARRQFDEALQRLASLDELASVAAPVTPPPPRRGVVAALEDIVDHTIVTIVYLARCPAVARALGELVRSPAMDDAVAHIAAGPVVEQAIARVARSPALDAAVSHVGRTPAMEDAVTCGAIAMVGVAVCQLRWRTATDSPLLPRRGAIGG